MQDRIAELLRDQMEAQPLVKRFANTATSAVGFLVAVVWALISAGVDISDIYVMLHPEEDWTRVQTKAELVDAIEEVLLHEVPGQNYSFSQPIELRTNELISGNILNSLF